MKKKLLRHTFRSLKRPKLLTAVLAVSVVALLGTTLMVLTRAATTSAAIEAENGVANGNAARVSYPSGGASNNQAVKFGASSGGDIPTSVKPCGVMAAPATYKHVVWIWMENQDQTDVIGSAPYIDALADKCGAATNVKDNATSPSLPSQPQYMAATSGSNCNTGITSQGSSGGGSGCVTDDDDGRTLTTQSIFQLIKSAGGTWKSYQESMPSNCATSSSGAYAYKHNPAAMYTQIRSDCSSLDVPIPTLNCGETSCPTPTGALVNDLKNGSLPGFSFVTPDLDNDMHDGSVQRGDSWLKAYLPLLFDGPNYKAGDTAVFIMWDEGSSNSNGVQDIPTVIAAPSIPVGAKVTTATNDVGLLKTTQEMLKLTPLLGCASGTPPGGTGTCNPSSSTSIKTAMNL